MPRGRAVRVLIHEDYSIGEHAHEFVEVNLVLVGSGWHRLHGRSLPLRAGHAFVMPPGVHHAYRSTRGLRVLHLLLHPRWLAEHHAALHQLPGFCLLFTVAPFLRSRGAQRHALALDPPRRRQLADLLTRIHAEERDAAPGHQLVCSGLALSAVALLARWCEVQPEEPVTSEPAWQGLRRALDRIHRQEGAAPGVAELAAAAGLSPRAFSRLFAAATGRSPRAYLGEQRIHRAAQLLRDSDLTLTVIALRLGFYDAGHFSRCFARQMGMAPSRYRAQMERETAKPSSHE